MLRTPEFTGTTKRERTKMFKHSHALKTTVKAENRFYRILVKNSFTNKSYSDTLCDMSGIELKRAKVKIFSELNMKEILIDTIVYLINRINMINGLNDSTVKLQDDHGIAIGLHTAKALSSDLLRIINELEELIEN